MIGKQHHLTRRRVLARDEAFLKFYCIYVACMSGNFGFG
jgi:hypothetical protein